MTSDTQDWVDEPPYRPGMTVDIQKWIDKLPARPPKAKRLKVAGSDGLVHYYSPDRSTRSSKAANSMPAVRSNAPQWSKDDKILCFHGELLYEAKVLDTKLKTASDPTSSHQYLVHYKGWKNTWDDWVDSDRIRKLTEENKELARTLQREYVESTRKVTSATKTHGKRKGAPDDSSHASEERQNSLPASGRGKRQREDLEKEEAYLSRPEVRIPTTDHIKCILVDDWEHITRNMLLVSLPSKMPFNRILGDYHDSEKLKRAPGSADLDILDEAMAGLKEYFSAGLGRVLLYAIEREQYAQLRQQWEANGQGPGDVYGGEHLLRLIVKLPELVAQTAMDQPAIQCLRGEMIKLAQWLHKNSSTYFLAEYENANDAMERIRGGN